MDEQWSKGWRPEIEREGKTFSSGAKPHSRGEIPQEPRYDPIWMFFTQPMIFLLRNRNPLNKELESAHIDFFE